MAHEISLMGGDLFFFLLSGTKEKISEYIACNMGIFVSGNFCLYYIEYYTVKRKYFLSMGHFPKVWIA